MRLRRDANDGWLEFVKFWRSLINAGDPHLALVIRALQNVLFLEADSFADSELTSGFEPPSLPSCPTILTIAASSLSTTQTITSFG
jgi:hypothetical protein